MIMMSRILKLLLVSLFVFSTTVAFSESPKTLVFSAIPDQDETRLKERFGGIAD